jgi:hypothetical protein
MPRQFTDSDIQIMQQAVSRIQGLVTDGDLGLKNGALIGEFFNNSTPITIASVQQAVDHLKAQLAWKTKLQMEADRVAAPMTSEQINLVAAWIKSRGLKSEGDDLLQNFVVIGDWLNQNRRQINFSEMDLSLKYLQGKPNWYRLRFVDRKQDSEIEADKRKPEEIVNPVTKKTKLTNEPTLDPWLEHIRNLNHETTVGEPKDSTDWERLAEDVLQNTRSHVVREKARKIMFANNGVPDWKAIFHARRRLIEQSGIR